MKRALICGVSGQDGAYLARLLLEKGYRVFGTSRSSPDSHFPNLARLGIDGKVTVNTVSLAAHKEVVKVLAEIEPDEVYNLAGQSSVGLSFEQPLETLGSIGVSTLNILEAIRFTSKKTRFYNACSGECLGDTGDRPADETAPFRPRSPYGVAKAAAFWATVNYREAYGLYSCSGILFNHESPLRPDRFVTKKIALAVCRAALGDERKLHLGQTAIVRDWGWAPEYVDAMWLMLQQDRPDDFVIATGESHSLEEFTETAFSSVDMDWRDYAVVDPGLFRPADIAVGRAEPAKARGVLGWEARHKMKEVAQMMVADELARCGVPNAA